MYSKIRGLISMLFALLASLLPSHAQFNITGVADKASPYANTATFTVGIQTGYSYAVFLNDERIPVGVPITVNEPDFYQIHAFATNVASGVVSTQWLRFIVEATERADTEWGIPRHTPSPAIPSAAAEFAGASLRIIAPEVFPAGYEIPVVAWVVNAQGGAVRVNGWLEVSGHPSIEMKRGVGSGFLAANNPAGPLVYLPQIKGVQTNKTINIEASTIWTSVSGTLSGATSWPDNSRIRVTGHIAIPAGSTLTIGAGAIVLLSPGVNITNNGSMLINGTVDQPVVFMPQSRSQPWGGYFMQTSTGVVDAKGTIFTGSGADPNGGAGHRDEQCLFFVAGSPRITLTDCAAIYLAGQFGHADNGGTFNFTRFLLQRATTGGEYTGANITVNDSAFIEFPGDSVIFENEDHDALYLVSGSHMFTNTMFGWTKDDGIDSGGDGAARIHYERCWFEATFHEGNSLSGLKNTTAFQTVFLNCGQGIEDGYGAGTGGPTGRVDNCLFALCQSGLRHGDNYPSIGNGYPGRIGATNSLFFQNHRDVFGFNWRTTGWTNATGQMTIISNWLSAPNIYFPRNTIWNPETDAALLAPFMSTPPEAAVGVGFAVRTNRFAMTALAQGVPVRLSSFATNAVHVSYVFYNGAGGGFIGGGTISFAPGETMKRIYPDFNPGAVSPWDLYLTAAGGGELTGLTNLTFEGSIPTPQVSLAVAGGVLPGYRIGEGTFIRLSAPSSQPVSVNYTNWANGNPVGSGTIGFSPPETLKQLFVTEVNPFDYSSIQITLSGPGGATLGVSSVTYTNPPLAVAFGVAGNQANIDLLSSGLPVSLNSPAPSGVSVQFRIEDFAGVLTNGTLTFVGGESSKPLVAPSINLAQQSLLRATLFSPTGATLGTPSGLYLVRSVPIPPATNTTLIARGSRWRYRDLASAAPAGWQNLGFNHEAWPEGPAQLGFSNNEENDEATLIADNNQITSYFRRGFSVTDSNAFTGLSLWLLRDDAGVVYLNGTEIFRSPNLPAPPTAITYNTTSGSPNGENTPDTATTNRNALRTGTNVIAVEIHQQSATSSDVSFDFELIGIGAPPTVPQNVYLGTFDGQFVFAWADPALILQQTDQLQGNNTVWIAVAGNSPIRITPVPNDPQRFYRLLKP